MTGASIEKTEQLWLASLEEAQGLLRPLFAQERVALSAGLFLEGLLGPERRKTGWMRAEAAGDPGPWRQQAILGRGCCRSIGVRVPFWRADPVFFEIASEQPSRPAPSLL